MAIIRRQTSLPHGGSKGPKGGGSQSGGRHGRTESLWLRYRRTRNAKTRNQLLERYRGIVEGMAMAMVVRLPRSVDVQDLTHAGMWGLMQAIENFEPERGIHFLTFMRLRVRGAMLDELRSLDYLPRLFRRRRRALQEAEVRLREDLQREPNDAELADELGVSESVFRLRFSPMTLSSIGNGPADVTDGEGDTDGLQELADDQLESPIEALHRQDLLAKIEASLQPVEWKVLRLHYLEGLSGKEVARRLRLSASRVCQIHGRVLSRLKTRLQPAD